MTFSFFNSLPSLISKDSSLNVALTGEKILKGQAQLINRALFFGVVAGSMDVIGGVAEWDFASLPQRFATGFAINAVATLWLDTTSPLLSAVPMLAYLMEINPIWSFEKLLVASGARIVANEILFVEEEKEEAGVGLKLA